MRIRRNSEMSSILFSTECYGGETPAETHVCHFNQSPWDVFPVTSSSYFYVPSPSLSTNIIDSPSSSSPPMFRQFDGEEDEFNGNVSLGDSNGASESLLVAAAETYERSPAFEDIMDPSDEADKKYKAVELNSPVNTSGDDEQVAVKMTVPPKRGRPRGTTKKTPASAPTSNNPYDFYYYSGFGPLWGRKRGGSGDEKVVNEKSSSSDDDEEEEDDQTVAYGGGDNIYDYDQKSEDGKMNRREKLMTMKKKKKKKPVKERSLQSLM